MYLQMPAHPGKNNTRLPASPACVLHAAVVSLPDAISALPCASRARVSVKATALPKGVNWRRNTFCLHLSSRTDTECKYGSLVSPCSHSDNQWRASSDWRLPRFLSQAASRHWTTAPPHHHHISCSRCIGASSLTPQLACCAHTHPSKHTVTTVSSAGYLLIYNYPVSNGRLVVCACPTSARPQWRPSLSIA